MFIRQKLTNCSKVEQFWTPRKVSLAFLLKGAIQHEKQLSLLHLYGVLTLVSQSCLTLCDSVDCSPPGSSVHVTLQAGTLEWFAIPFSSIYMGNKPPILMFVSLVAQSVKNLPAIWETWIWSLVGSSLGGGHGNPLQYSCLENPQGQSCLAGFSPWDGNTTEWLSTAQSYDSTPEWNPDPWGPGKSSYGDPKWCYWLSSLWLGWPPERHIRSLWFTSGHKYCSLSRLISKN